MMGDAYEAMDLTGPPDDKWPDERKTRGMADVYDPYHDVHRATKSYWTCAVAHHEHLTMEGAQACIRHRHPERFDA